jgi:hypothetical protein
MATIDSTQGEKKIRLSDITEQSKFIIGRFDHYFDSINNKGVFYITINTFLLGGLLSQVGEIIKSGNGSWWIYTLVLGFILINVSSTILTIPSISPFKSPKCDDPSSLLYFHDIACKDLNSFKKEYTTQSEDFAKLDFTNQIHQLAGGLKIKFDRLRYAGILLLFQFVSLVPIIVITILSVK